MTILMILSLAVIALVAFTQIRHGIVNAFGTCFATLVSGLLAFEFWPMLAYNLSMPDTILENLEDAIALTLVFCVSVVILRKGISSMTRDDFGFSHKTEQIGAIGFGIVTGYLVSGFVVCVLQTLPWEKEFLGFDYNEDGLAPRILPADQAWLKLVLYASEGSFAPIDMDKDSEREAAKNARDYCKRAINEFSATFAQRRRLYGDQPKNEPKKEAPVQPPKDPDPKDKKDPKENKKDKEGKDGKEPNPKK